MKLKLAYIFALITLFTSITNAAPLYQQVLYQRGMNNIHTYRIPSLIQAPDGTILAFCEARVDGGGDEDNINIVLRRSRDAGKTWSAMQVIWDEGVNTCGNPTALLDETNSRIWLFMNHNLGHDRLRYFVNGTSQGRRTTWCCYSDDNGKTWSAPIQLKHIKAPAEEETGNLWDAVGPGNGIQLKQGPHAGRLIVPANARNIYSDDHGKTWHEGTIFYPNGGNEGTVVELTGGAILRNDRMNDLYAQYRRRLYCYSYDQGETWTPTILHDQLITPMCQAAIISYPVENNRQYLLFSNPASFSRNNMTVRLSYNDGLSWPVSRMIWKYNSAYSSLVRLKDGRVGLLYENGDGSAYQQITFALFDIDWVKDDSVFRWDFENLSKSQLSAQTIISDTMGYNLSGKLTHNIQTAPGGDKTTALRFSGEQGVTLLRDQSSGYLDLFADTDFYLKAVFRTQSHGPQQKPGALISNDYAPGQPSWWLRVQDGKLKFYILDERRNSSAVDSKTKVNDNKWHEALIVHNAAEQKLQIYLDGKLNAEQSSNCKGSYVNDKNISVGQFNNGSSGFIGDLDLAQISYGLPNLKNTSDNPRHEVILKVQELN